MSNPTIRNVPMPPTAKHPNGHNLPLKDRVLVVVGANGSGKTRFGAWLDMKDAKLHHRVSAHRSLVFPERVQPMDYEEAELRLLTGQIANRAVPQGEPLLMEKKRWLSTLSVRQARI